MVHVLHLLPPQLPTGTVKQLSLLCGAGEDLGIASSVVSLESHHGRQQQLLQFPLGTTFCRRRSPWDVTFVPRFRKYLKTLGRPVDCVHVWGAEWSLLAMLIAGLPRGLPMAVAQRDFRGLSQLGRLPDWGQRPLRIVVNHPDLQSLVPTSKHHAPVVVIRNATTSATSMTRPSLHRQLGVPSDVRLVAVIGDLVAKKRIKDLIWAMDLLRVIHPQTHLLVIGDGPERAALEEYSRQVNLDPCVHFLGTRQDVADILPQCFCLWQASADEGCANSVLEAMQAAIPVVVSDIPGHQLMVQQSVHGFLVPVSDCAEFARKTNTLLQQPELVSAMGRAGREQVMRDFSLASAVTAYRDVYGSLAQNTARQAA